MDEASYQCRECGRLYHVEPHVRNSRSPWLPVKYVAFHATADTSGRWFVVEQSWSVDEYGNRVAV